MIEHRWYNSPHAAHESVCTVAVCQQEHCDDIAHLHVYSGAIVRPIARFALSPDIHRGCIQMIRYLEFMLSDRAVDEGSDAASAGVNGLLFVFCTIGLIATGVVLMLRAAA